METPIKERKAGNWNNVAELIDFKIVKIAPQGLLGVAKADVLLLYKKKIGEKDDDQKRLLVFGPEDAVFDRVIQKINEKKNPGKAAALKEKFVDAWKTTDQTIVNRSPNKLFSDYLNTYGLNAKEFSERSGIAAPTIYHHTSGNREISKQVAEEYAAKLNCDPVDLMFEKKFIPIWSKVNLLKSVELETYYAPGQLYAYAAQSELERVIVPRDLYRDDMKAIKIDARGSMYHNKVCFYYRSSTKEENVNNQLCIVGKDHEPFPDVIEEYYYFGLYEEIRGKANLINPDPYVTGEDKFILKDFTPTFITPIISVLNPEAVVDKTKLKSSIPSFKLVREEEQLKRELEVAKAQQAAEAEVKSLLNKVEEITKKINEETKKKSGIMSALFKKETDVMKKLQDDQANILDMTKRRMRK